MDKYEHGGNIAKISNDITTTVWIDFSANINPLGLPKSVKTALVDNLTCYERYPDPDCSELAGVIGGQYGVDEESIVCGNGAIDLIYRSIAVLKPENALLTSPAFSEYEKALSEHQCHIRFYERKEENQFRIDEDYLEAMTGMDLIILCEPNNPTGNLTSAELLKKIWQKAAQEHIFVIVDECFMDFVSDRDYAMYDRSEGDIIPNVRASKMKRRQFRLWGLDETQQPSVLVIKAFTKTYAMAGLRLGYAFCNDRELIGKMKCNGPVWRVSVPAQVAGAAAMRDTEYLFDSREYIQREREYLTDALRAEGYYVYDSVTNFLLIRQINSDDDGRNQERLYERLIKKGIVIRKCDNFAGLGEDYFRLAVRSHEENERLMKVLKG